MMLFKNPWMTASIVSALFAAGCGFYAAAFIEIRDNLDLFMSDIARQSFWTSIAATFAAIAVILEAIDHTLKHRRRG
jgi:hypothetical protein